MGEVGPDKGRWCNERTGTYRVKVSGSSGEASSTSISLFCIHAKSREFRFNFKRLTRRPRLEHLRFRNFCDCYLRVYLSPTLCYDAIAPSLYNRYESAVKQKTI